MGWSKDRVALKKRSRRQRAFEHFGVNIAARGHRDGADRFGGQAFVERCGQCHGAAGLNDKLQMLEGGRHHPQHQVVTHRESAGKGCAVDGKGDLAGAWRDHSVADRPAGRIDGHDLATLK